MAGKRFDLYLDEDETKKAVKKAKAEIDSSYSLSMLVRQLLKKFLKGEVGL